MWRKVNSRGLQLLVACVCLIGCATQSFATNTDRAAAAVERREGVTIGGGDGSSFDKAIIVHAASLPQALFGGFEYVALRYGWIQISNGSTVQHKGKFYKILTYENHKAMADPKPKRVFYFDVTEYLPTHSVAPEYPREAREKGLTGKGIAVVKVDPTTGHVTSVSMIKSTGRDVLDNAVQRALQQWHFRSRGLTTFEIPIQFTKKGVIY
jgi:TonB family protein